MVILKSEKSCNLVKIDEIRNLFDQKLYFDTWMKIKQFIENPVNKKDNLLDYLVDIILPINIDLFNQDALGFNIHPLEFTILATKISDFKKTRSIDSATNFLQKNLEFLKSLKNNSFKPKDALNSQFLESILILKTNQTMLRFDRNLREAGKILNEGEWYIRKQKKYFQNVEPEVYRRHYWLALNYYKSQKFADASKYLEACVNYLFYQPIQSLDSSTRQVLACDIIHATLFSEDTFNFGKALFHPIMDTLKNSSHKKLLYVLKAFDQGNIAMFNRFKHCLVTVRQPLRKTHNIILEEKIRLMALTILCWKNSPSLKSIQFTSISSTCRIKKNKVEYVLMRAMSKGLIKGKIDELKSSVTIFTVLPRDINELGIMTLLQKINAWLNQLEKINMFLTQHN